MCEIDCANPAQNLIYEFIKLKNLDKTTLKNDSTNVLNYKIEPDEDVIEIICTVYNSILVDSAYKNESQTRFLLHSKSSTEGMSLKIFFIHHFISKGALKLKI